MLSLPCHHVQMILCFGQTGLFQHALTRTYAFIFCAFALSVPSTGSALP